MPDGSSHTYDASDDPMQRRFLQLNRLVSLSLRQSGTGIYSKQSNAMRTCCLLQAHHCHPAAVPVQTVTVFWAQRPVVTETIALAAFSTPRSQHHSGRKSFWFFYLTLLFHHTTFTLLAFNIIHPDRYLHNEKWLYMAPVGLCLSIVNLRVIFAEKDRFSIHC